MLFTETDAADSHDLEHNDVTEVVVKLKAILVSFADEDALCICHSVKGGNSLEAKSGFEELQLF